MNRLGLMALLFFMMAGLGEHDALGAELPKRWIGVYSYPDASRVPVGFELRVTSATENRFAGTTREAATFGKQPCDELRANIVGQFSARGISFKKTYDGSCDVSHSVQYEGKLDAGLRTMTGKWSIGSASGQFVAGEAKDTP